ncbi:hypothetical protein EON65_19300 [archaeon]|nr:MAG: hypothetical protein EON65_19300 [archaeon]
MRILFPAVLSGKELFNYNSSLFIDDDSAFDTSDDKKLNEELQQLEEQEKKRQEEEVKKAQAEQERLMAVHLMEIEAQKHRVETRRQAALAPNRITFTFQNVVINQVVFDEDDEEDLDLFSDDEFGKPSQQILNSIIAMYSKYLKKEEESKVAEVEVAMASVSALSIAEPHLEEQTDAW